MSEMEIFTEAMLRPDGPERVAFLDAACGSDSSLRQRVA
jgi:hypothetical protein